MKLAEKYFIKKFGVEKTKYISFLLNKRIPIRKIDMILFFISERMKNNADIGATLVIESLIGIENTKQLYSL